MSGIGGDGEQSFGSGLKQNGVNLSRVLKRQAADLLRKSEHDVEVRNGQELRFPLGEPLGAGRGLALWATPIPTRVEYLDAMSAPVALIEMTAQDGSPAVTNVSERFPLLARQHGVPASQEIVLMRKTSASSSRCGFILSVEGGGAIPAIPRDWWSRAHARRRLADSARWFPGWHGRAGSEWCGD